MRRCSLASSLCLPSLPARNVRHEPTWLMIRAHVSSVTSPRAFRYEAIEMVSTLVKVVSAPPKICPASPKICSASLFVHSVSFSLLTAWLPWVPAFPTVCSDKALTLASQGFVVCGKKRLCYRVMRLFFVVMRLCCVVMRLCYRVVRLCYRVMRLCACCVGAVVWGYSMMMFSPSSPSCLSVVAGLGLFLSLPCSSNSP